MTTPIENFLKNITIGHETAFDLADRLDGKGSHLTVTHRKVLPEAPRAPVRAEPKARSHQFMDAVSLGDFIARNPGPNIVVFADPVNEVMWVVLDDKAHVELCSMRPQVHPLFKPWAGIIGEDMEVTEFAKFLMANRSSITEPDGPDLALQFSQIRASQKVEIQRGKGKNKINGVMVTTEIQGTNAQNRTEFVNLPDRIVLEVPLYISGAPERVELDLVLDTTGEGKDVEVVVSVSGATVADAKVKAFEKMIAQAQEKCASTGALFTLGLPNWAAKNYLKEIPRRPDDRADG